MELDRRHFRSYVAVTTKTKSRWKSHDDKNKGFLARLGPGLITGASDDDPSGIGTYSQAGAQLGFGISWTMLLTYPLMAAIQEISARVGRVTGHGIAGNVCRNFPAPVMWSLVILLFIANTINVAADLGAMADSLRLLVGGPGFLYVVVFGCISVSAQIFLEYRRYVAILKWLTLALFAYVAALAVVKVPSSEALRGLLVPTIQWDGAFLTTLVALLGTTISPYLFIWQSSQEAEEQRIDPDKKPLKLTPSKTDAEFTRIRIDTLVGMALSNIIGIAIIITTASTLHANGKTNIETSAQAAEALRPLVGAFAETIIALGIIGTGLLAIPVLAGSTAYAIGEGRKWPVGLSRKPAKAAAFYAVLAVSVFLGIGLNFTPLEPIKALYWSAVVNGVLAPPVMVLLMLLVRKEKVMGKLLVEGWLYWVGWIATAAMALSIIGMAISIATGQFGPGAGDNASVVLTNLARHEIQPADSGQHCLLLSAPSHPSRAAVSIVINQSDANGYLSETASVSTCDGSVPPRPTFRQAREFARVL